MTDAQVSLLKRLIEADRRYHSAKARGELVDSDDRGVEVGSINGVDSRTARSLADVGLAEIIDIGRHNPYVFLGSINPYDPE